MLPECEALLLLCQSGAVVLCAVQEAGIASGGVCPACDLAVPHFWQFRSGPSFPLLHVIFTQLSVSLTTMGIYFIPISSSN